MHYRIKYLYVTVTAHTNHVKKCDMLTTSKQMESSIVRHEIEITGIEKNITSHKHDTVV
jgi:hypothetical protein